MARMHIVPPSAGRRAWKIRFRIDGRWARVGAEMSRNGTLRFANRVALLLEAKANGDAPPLELNKWIEGLPERKRERLIALGLLDRQRGAMGIPVDGLIEQYRAEVAGRRGNTDRHAAQTAGRVRAALAGGHAVRLGDLDASSVQRWLNEQTMQPATRRGYLMALVDFGAWLRAGKMTRVNPFAVDGPPPMPRPTPQYDRRPFSVDELRALLGYMATPPGDCVGRALAADERRMLYWLAAFTGYRRSELAALRVSGLLLDDATPSVLLPGRATKNRQDAAVPIPRELAEALRDWTRGRLPGAAVVRIPHEMDAVPGLHADLRGAGLGHVLEAGQRVDFHCFRVTAICYWLNVLKLDPLTVQRLARLSMLAMVQRYSRGFRAHDFGWLGQVPSMVESGTAAARPSAR